MIYLGIGVDIIDNLRIKKSLSNKKFLKRIFSDDELNKAKKIKNKTSFFSKRFAAKEAFSKALGTGFRNGLNFKDISVVNDKYGKPFIKIDSRIKSLILKKFNIKNFSIFLSISDEIRYSIAFVILNKK